MTARGEVSTAVLITGCSSGIGRATAERLARSGRRVYASARHTGDIEDLRDLGCEILRLEVTDERSRKAAVAKIEKAEGAVGVLVNNAGYGQEGAVETVTLEQMRRQFETNFFGLVRLSQLVLPGMRAQGWGRIVNVSSMGGRLVLPAGGIYHASKYAVEAVSDALRYEVRPFGVDVVLVEPGQIRTRWGATAVDAIEDAEADGAYGEFNRTWRALIHEVYEGRLARFGAHPDAVARVIERAIVARRPRTRYPVTIGARVLIQSRRFLPDRAFDAMLRGASSVLARQTRSGR